MHQVLQNNLTEMNVLFIFVHSFLFLILLVSIYESLFERKRKHSVDKSIFMPLYRIPVNSPVLQKHIDAIRMAAVGAMLERYLAPSSAFFYPVDINTTEIDVEKLLKINHGAEKGKSDMKSFIMKELAAHRAIVAYCPVTGTYGIVPKD